MLEWDLTPVGRVLTGTSIVAVTIIGGLHPKVQSVCEPFLQLTIALVVPFHSARFAFSIPKNAPPR